MKRELLDVYRQLQKFQLQLHSLLNAIPAQLNSSSIEDSVDSGFLAREISRIADDIRKGCDQKQAMICRFLAVRVGAASAMGENLQLRGELATGVADLKVKPKFPDNETEDYYALMEWITGSPELARNPMLRPSFSAMASELSRRAESGEKPPPGILSTFTEASVVFRKRVSKQNDV